MNGLDNGSTRIFLISAGATGFKASPRIYDSNTLILVVSSHANLLLVLITKLVQKICQFVKFFFLFLETPRNGLGSSHFIHVNIHAKYFMFQWEKRYSAGRYRVQIDRTFEQWTIRMTERDSEDSDNGGTAVLYR